MTAFVPQGTLNRLRCSIVVPQTPYLSITAPYMGKSFAKVTFGSSFGELIPTATGGVTSPEPYVMSTVTVGLLRTQSLSSSWLEQSQLLCDIGAFVVYPDSSNFPFMTFQNGIINDIDPGAFDGTDPVFKLTLKGIFYANSTLWASS